MKSINRYLQLSAVLVLTLMTLMLLMFGFNVKNSKASLSRIQEPTACSTQGTSATSLATTSVVYMTAGTATTTATCNMMTVGGGTEVFDSATLQVQFAGSSTASTLNIDIQDSNNGRDWYSRSLAWEVDGSVATSSPSIGGIQTYTFTFASSTQNKQGITNINSATSTREINIKTPMTFVRAVFTLPPSSEGGAIWANFVGKTEVN